ncbi:Oligopeptide transport system permease protein op pB [Streptococcus gallolyticus]|uniref:Oligopeptide transport system permease protein op pB n=1 Tax=Streptococcus gallolyticus TaxID=315405 RepID=A0A060RHB0_9STRE|nr:ABC transporter permease [Streptococcus gallolyticus]CDO17892.1 Oligopeptide transport system permease protein op pB [Streptococcus gallolyticus]
MKKYIGMRVLRSFVSILLVTTLTYGIIYSLVPRHLIFKQDPNYNKMVTTPDKRINYESLIYSKTGYIDYMDSKDLQKKASKIDSEVTTAVTTKNKKIYQKYIKSIGRNWQLYQFPESKKFYAIRDIPLYERVFRFYSHLIVIDHPWKIKDASNPNLKRYVRFENDPAIGPALVGSGTEHKYLLYFNGSFPYIHQNIITMNLGISYPTYANLPILQVIGQGQGKTEAREVTFPTGKTKMSSIDIYSRTYKSPKKADAMAIDNFGKGDAYTATRNHYSDPSMVSNSVRIGIIGVIISYAFGLPIGLLMARFKNGFFDRFSTGVTTFLLALPSIAIIYAIRFIGSALGLPDSFPALGAHDWRSYALPAFILGFLSIPGTVVWFRRYVVDLQNSDFVRFARAKGLSENEISRKHLFKQAMVPVVNGIPEAILGTIVGATLTETIFAFPGMGKMLIDSIKATNNAMVVGLVFLFTSLSVISLLLGDLLMVILDPRIKLASKGGKR